MSKVEVPICPSCTWWVLALCRKDDGNETLYFLKCRACDYETEGAITFDELPVTWGPSPEA